MEKYLGKISVKSFFIKKSDEGRKNIPVFKIINKGAQLSQVQVVSGPGVGEKDLFSNEMLVLITS